LNTSFIEIKNINQEIYCGCLFFEGNSIINPNVLIDRCLFARCTALSGSAMLISFQYGEIYITRTRFEENKSELTAHDIGVAFIQPTCVEYPLKGAFADSTCSTSEFEERVCCNDGCVLVLLNNCTDDYVFFYFFYMNIFLLIC
jgi:hypothetical protein